MFGAIFIDGRTGAVHLPVPIETIFGFIASYLVYPALGLVFYIFPDGRFVPRWSWVFMLVWIAVAVEYNLPSTSFLNYANLSPLLQIIETIIQFGSAFGIMIYRYVRHFDRQQRQQTKWVLFIIVVTFLIIFPLTNLNLFFPALSNPASLYQLANATVIAQIFYLSIPLAFVIAILRYRLWDIDIVINRTLVYGTLTISVIVLYVLVVLGFGSLIQARGNLLLSLLATGLIAVLFQPSRQRLQQGVNRLMYGERDEPYRVLSRLGQRLEASLTPEAVLPTIVETVAQALKLPFAAITQVAEGVEFKPVAVYGEFKEQAAYMRVPLIYQNENVGELALGSRREGEALTPADQRFLRDLMPQIGVAVHAVRLTADLKQLTIDLQRSRERLVTAREEERRRLRRDLHDGLGPQLSSQTLTLTAARKLLRHDPDAADTLLADATTHAQAAIADIRRLVYALRPPALDDFGLIAAIQEQIHHYRSSGVMLILDAPESLSHLPAAVEVACYRIVQEALTNVVRHAHAHVCTVSLSPEKLPLLRYAMMGKAYRLRIRVGWVCPLCVNEPKSWVETALLSLYLIRVERVS